MDEYPEEGFFRDETGRLSLKASLEHARDYVFVGTCMAIFGAGVLWALDSWGVLAGLIVGGLLSALLSAGLFIFALDRPQIRWSVAGLVVVTGLLIIGPIAGA